MKKFLTFFLLVGATIGLAACSTTNDQEVVADTLSSEASLATLSYLSAGFLDFTSVTVQDNFAFLSATDETETEIEGELDEVNVYFDRLKALIDNGVDSFGSVLEEASDNELYEFKLTFTVNEEIYIIYYNLDAETGEMTGIIVIGDQEYEFQVVDNMREYEYRTEEKEQHEEQEQNQPDDTNQNANQESNTDNNNSGTDEEEGDTEEDPDDTSTEATNDEEETDDIKMVLIATNGEDTIKIKYMVEVEDDETVTKFTLEQTIAGVESEVKLKIVQEEDFYKVSIEDDGNDYTFKKTIEDEAIIYMLNYKVDGVVGMVKITETTDLDGNVVYDYQIVEAGQEKHVEKQEPKSKGFDEEEDEEESTEESNEA